MKTDYKKILAYSIAIFLTMVSFVLYLVINKGSMTTYKYILNITSIVLVALPILAELIFGVRFSITSLILYWVFVVVSQLLGTTWSCYTYVSWLDNLAHCYSGFLICVLSYSILNGIHKNASPWLVVLFGIGFVMTVGVVWEIIEYFGDEWFNTNNQHIRENGVDLVGHMAVVDTMVDLMMDLLGAIVSSIVYVVLNAKGKTISSKLLIKRK